MSVLLDTSVVIDVLRTSASALAFFNQLASRPSISLITIAEVGVGLRRRSEENDATLFWSLVRVHPVDEAAAIRAGQFVRRYGPSHGIELPDALIAATAKHHGLKLATLNVKHFPMFPKLTLPY